MSMNEEEKHEQLKKLETFFEAFEAHLRPEIRNIVKAVNAGLDSPEWSIEIPDPNAVDLTIYDLGSIVAKTANHYGRMARLAGIAQAQLKLSDTKYKRSFKAAKIGKNEDEREKNATQAAHVEHLDLAIVEAAVEIANALERAARIASESARKIYDKVLAQAQADQRAGHVSP